MTLKILAVTLRYPPYTAGGYELLTRDGVEGLRERGHDVVVLCGRADDLEDGPELLPWLEPRLDSAEDLFDLDRAAGPLERLRLHYLRPSNLRATKRAIAEKSPDLVLYFNLGLVSLAPLVAARQAGVPSLGYICDPWVENHWLRELADHPSKAWRRPILGPLWKALRRYACMPPMLCASDWLRNRLVADGWGQDEVGVLPTGLAPSMDRLAAAGQPPAQVQGRTLRIICTSMLWGGKGQDVLVEAFIAARREGLDAELVRAGRETSDGEFSKHRRWLAQEAGGTDLIHYPGMLPQEELSELIFQSDIFVLPSIWGEPFGLATIEGMAHGICPVVSDSGASPELVGDAGIVVPTRGVEELTRVLLELSGDPERRAALGAAARKRAFERFGRDVFVERLEAAALAVAAGEQPVDHGEDAYR
ncbi:MAG: glycosyltransferase family 4 protein [Planctomycetota bacterium]|nr:glycosyltransferase family 4 protein [Planctomycetota bacterium]